MIVCEGDRCRLAGRIAMDDARRILEAGRAGIIAATTEIDLSGLEEMDSSVVGLLLAWRREHPALRFVNAPANLQSLAVLYGLQELLQPVHS